MAYYPVDYQRCLISLDGLYSQYLFERMCSDNELNQMERRNEMEEEKHQDHLERQFIPQSWWCSCGRSSPRHKSCLYSVWPFVSASNHASLPSGPRISEELSRPVHQVSSVFPANSCHLTPTSTCLFFVIPNTPT